MSEPTNQSSKTTPSATSKNHQNQASVQNQVTARNQAKPHNQVPLQSQAGSQKPPNRPANILLRGFKIALATTLGLVLVGALVLWGIAMPVRNLPVPTGPFGVGSVSYDVTDYSREDPYAPVVGNPPGPRTLRVQLWYPAETRGQDQSTMTPQPWMVDGLEQIQGIVNNHGFPGFIWNHTVFMRSNSFSVGPDPTKGPWPVVLISHGWEGYRGLHSDVAEELASHGYVVAALEHSYGSAATLLDDGRLLLSSPRVLPARNQSDRFGELASRLVQTYADDNRFLLEHLAQIQAGLLGDRTESNGTATSGTLTSSAPTSPGSTNDTPTDTGTSTTGTTTSPQVIAILNQLQGKLDLTRIGLVGHSTGGGAMVRLVIDLQRTPTPATDNHHSPPTSDRNQQPEPQTDNPPNPIRAVVGLDAWVEPVGKEDLASGDFTLPGLFLRSEQWEGGINDGYLVPFVQGLETPGELYQIRGITHQQFTTLYMYAPVVRWLGMLGQADPFEFMEYQRNHVLRFLNHHLKDEDYSLPEYDRIEQIQGVRP